MTQLATESQELEYATQYEYDSKREVVYVNALEIKGDENIPQHRIDLFFDESSQEVMATLLNTPGVTELRIKGSHVVNMLTGGTFFASAGEPISPAGFSDIDVDVIGSPNELEFPASAHVKSKTITNRVTTASGVPMDIVKPGGFEEYEIAAATELMQWLDKQENQSMVASLKKRAKNIVGDNENRMRHGLPIERSYYMHETLTVSTMLENGQIAYTLNDPYNVMETAFPIEDNPAPHSRAAITGPTRTVGIPVRRVEGIKAVLMDAIEIMSDEEVESPAYLHALEAVARSNKFSIENSITFDLMHRETNDLETRHANTLKRVLRGETVDMKGDFLGDRGFESVADVVKVRLHEMASRGMAVNQLGFYQTFIQELELTEALSPTLGDLYTGVEKNMLPTFADFARNSLDENGEVPHSLDSYLIGVHNALIARYKNYVTPLGRRFPKKPHEPTIEAGMYKMAYAYMVAQEDKIFTQEVVARPKDGEFHASRLVQGKPTTDVVDTMALLLYSHNRYDTATLESVVANWQLEGSSTNHWSEHGTAINNSLDLAELKAKIDYYKDKYAMPFADTHPLNKSS